MTERTSVRAGKLCIGWCAALLVMAAIPPEAHAEGGLPGSLGTVVESTQSVAPAWQQGGASPTETHAADTAGGAVFSPFAELSSTRASGESPVLQESDPRSPDHNFTLVVAAAGAVAIAWLLLRDV